MTQALMMRALEAQRSGRLVDAAADYEAALADEPSNFDALHMLGVVRFQQGKFEHALALLDRALAIMPGNAAARFNRRLVAQGLERRIVEDELARAVLPAFARFVQSTIARSDEPVNAVIAASEPGERDVRRAERAARVIGNGRLIVWRETSAPLLQSHVPDLAPSPGTRDIDVERWVFPHDANVVFVGAARSPGSWWSYCRPLQVLLVVDSYAPGDIAERVRELSGDGERRVGLAYASPELARRVSLPGILLETGS